MTPTAKQIEAGLAELRSRKLLEYVFADEPDSRGAYGYVADPIEAETQREIVNDIYTAMLAAEPVSEEVRESMARVSAFIRRQSQQYTYADNGHPWSVAAEYLLPHLERVEAAIAALGSSPVQGETWASIAQWCEETFGPVTAKRIAERASEEMQELLDSVAEDMAWTGATRSEAADVLICLARVPGIWEAVEQKMAINRARKWRLTGDGCGHHIPAPPSLGSEQEGM